MTETTPATATTTTPTSRNFVILDPNTPAGLQPESVLDCVYSRYMPELSLLANSVFKDATLKLKAEAAHTVSIWIPSQRPRLGDPVEDSKLEIPVAAAVNSSGTPVPKSDINPKIKVPVRTLVIDPRHKEYGGDPELVAVHLGRTLAKHVHEEIERIHAETGKKIRAWFGDVEVIGEIPSHIGETEMNGLKLTATAPLLYARMFVHLRQD